MSKTVKSQKHEEKDPLAQFRKMLKPNKFVEEHYRVEFENLNWIDSKLRKEAKQKKE